MDKLIKYHFWSTGLILTFMGGLWSEISNSWEPVLVSTTGLILLFSYIFILIVEKVEEK